MERQLTKTLVETISVINEVLKGKDMKVFSAKEIQEKLGITYMSTLMRLRRLEELGFLKRVVRGVYAPTQKFYDYVKNLGGEGK